MNARDTLNKSSDSIFTELSEAVERLKKQANDKFRESRKGTEDEYELAYMRGYFFGQLAALEDCYNLFLPFLAKIAQDNKSSVVVLKQQLWTSIKIIEDIIEKIKNNQPADEYIELIQNTVLLIKESYKIYD